MTMLDPNKYIERNRLSTKELHGAGDSKNLRLKKSSGSKADLIERQIQKQVLLRKQQQKERLG